MHIKVIFIYISLAILFNCEDNVSDTYTNNSGYLKIYFNHNNIGYENKNSYEVVIINDSLSIKEQYDLSNISNSSVFKIDNLKCVDYKINFNWYDSNQELIKTYKLGKISISSDSVLHCAISITNLNDIYFSTYITNLNYNSETGNVKIIFNVRSFESQSHSDIIKNSSGGNVVLRSYVDKLLTYLGKIDSSGIYLYKNIPTGYYSCQASIKDHEGILYTSPFIQNVFVSPDKVSNININVRSKLLMDQLLNGRYIKWNTNFSNTY